MPVAPIVNGVSLLLMSKRVPGNAYTPSWTIGYLKAVPLMSFVAVVLPFALVEPKKRTYDTFFAIPFPPYIILVSALVPVIVIRPS
jgi:hypothetical protein